MDAFFAIGCHGAGAIAFSGAEVVEFFLFVTDEACEDDVVEFDPFIDGLDAVSELLKLGGVMVEVAFEGGEGAG